MLYFSWATMLQQITSPQQEVLLGLVRLLSICKANGEFERLYDYDFSHFETEKAVLFVYGGIQKSLGTRITLLGQNTYKNNILV